MTKKYDKKEPKYLLCYRKINPMEEVCSGGKREIEEYIVDLMKKGFEIEGFIICNGIVKGSHDVRDYDLINNYKPSMKEFTFIREMLIDRKKFKEHLKNVKKTKTLTFI